MSQLRDVREGGQNSTHTHTHTPRTAAESMADALQGDPSALRIRFCVPITEILLSLPILYGQVEIWQCGHSSLAAMVENPNLNQQKS